MDEIKKYVLRAGAVVIGLIPFIMLLGGGDAVKVLLYKVGLVAVGMAMAELYWAIFFKPYYGRTEEMFGNEKLSVMLFRAILYASIILALTLGL